MRRCLVLPVVPVIAAVLALGSATTAWAAWAASASGTSSARAGTLGTPSVSASATTCQVPLQRSTLSWATIAGAAAYTVDVSTTGSFPGTATSTTATSTTVTARSALAPTTYSVRVRATAGEWTSPWSATTTVTLGACVL